MSWDKNLPTCIMTDETPFIYSLCNAPYLRKQLNSSAVLFSFWNIHNQFGIQISS